MGLLTPIIFPLFALVVFGTWVSQVTSLTLSDANITEMHEVWMARYGRVYDDNGEKDMRRDIFKENVEFIELFNSLKNRSYKLGINKFADRTNKEFKASLNGHKLSNDMKKSHGATTFRYENLSSVPESIDWRLKGAVTQVKDQESCGSCWAFSAIAATEGITQLKTGKLISLSEQELVDCNRNSKSLGCEGGNKENAFEFLRGNGINTEYGYPYQGVDESCDTTKEAVQAAHITGYEMVPANNEDALLKAVSKQPVSVSIDAGGDAFQFYESGVFTGECGKDLNHDLTAVGYGVDSSGMKYWLVKNSWGTSWGDAGYIMIQRNVEDKQGLCGIAIEPSFPTLQSAAGLKSARNSIFFISILLFVINISLGL